MQPQYRFLFIILLALSLGACNPVQIKPDTNTQVIDRAKQQEADRLAGAGDHAGAARLYHQLAAGMQSPQRESFLLLTAEQYYAADDIESAARVLARLKLTHPVQDFKRRLLAAEVANRQDRPEDAFTLLSQPLPESMDQTDKLRFHRTRAESLRLMGNILESATELSQIDPLLEDLQQRLDNQFAIIETLAVMTDTALDLLQPYPPGVLGGWMELTRLIKAHAGDQQQLQLRIDEWHQDFPEHPAMPDLLGGYFQQLKGQYRTAQHVAVLLPATGPYAKAAGALRDGILAAHYNQPSDKRPELRFYDDSNAAATWPLYQQAVDAGAELIIGPLLKESVEQLTRSGELLVPVLALNQIPPEVIPPADLYQFGLSPEDEARQAAERAWNDGHRSALVLIPNDNFGQRMLQAFRNSWEQMGGRLAEYQTYNPAEYDFAAPIRDLLDLEENTIRTTNEQGKVEVRPQHRQDASFIFLVSYFQNARQIRPQLQFHYAADMPVYATSHIYAGHPDPIQDQDIEGVIFPEIPWLLVSEPTDPLSRENLQAALNYQDASYLRLLAMGMDSYRLLSHLARLQANPRETFGGATGQLSLDDIRHVHHKMMWAKIVHANPEVLDGNSQQDTPIPATDESATTE